MTHDSPEFDAALAVTELEKSKADGIKSLIAASKASAAWQQRAQKAEAMLESIRVLSDKLAVADVGPHGAWPTIKSIRAALEES